MSGLSIVASAILKLAKLDSYICICHIITSITQKLKKYKTKNIISLHLSVMYKDGRISYFDRKLVYGSGSSMYGLEYAKSLHMDIGEV